MVCQWWHRNRSSYTAQEAKMKSHSQIGQPYSRSNENCSFQGPIARRKAGKFRLSRYPSKRSLSPLLSIFSTVWAFSCTVALSKFLPEIETLEGNRLDIEGKHLLLLVTIFYKGLEFHGHFLINLSPWKQNRQNMWTRFDSLWMSGTMVVLNETKVSNVESSSYHVSPLQF